MDNLTVKRGDTFSVLCQKVDESGNPLDISSYAITSTIKSVGGFTQNLSVSILDATTGQFVLNATATNTQGWPVFKAMDGTQSVKNVLYCDVQYTSSPYVESSETFYVYVIEDIT